jgi:hypothetical protein
MQKPALRRVKKLTILLKLCTLVSVSQTYGMKVFYFLIIALAFFSGCSKSPDSPNPGGGSGITDTQAPSAPNNVSGTATYNSVQLNWTASTDNVGVNGYKVFRNGTLVNTSGTNSYTDNGLAASTAYSYSISAYDAAGNNSAPSSAFTITTLLADTASIITGRWSVIKDSVSNVGNFYFIQGGTTYIPNGGIYTGVPADYWDFNSNGTLAAYENGNGYSNIPYHFAGNGRLFINELSQAYNDAFILQLSTTNATLFWTNTSPNGGVYTRKLYLRK